MSLLIVKLKMHHAALAIVKLSDMQYIQNEN